MSLTEDYASRDFSKDRDIIQTKSARLSTQEWEAVVTQLQAYEGQQQKLNHSSPAVKARHIWQQIENQLSAPVKPPVVLPDMPSALGGPPKEIIVSVPRSYWSELDHAGVSSINWELKANTIQLLDQNPAKSFGRS